MNAAKPSVFDPILAQAKYVENLLTQTAGALENLVVRIENAKEAESHAKP